MIAVCICDNCISLSKLVHGRSLSLTVKSETINRRIAG